MKRRTRGGELTRRESLARDAWRDLLRNPLFVIAAICVAALIAMAAWPGLFAGWFGNGDPRACDLANSSRGPAAGHPFGFDTQGCDLYANVIYGARASVLVGVLASLICFLIAVVSGLLAGYGGRILDVGVSRLADVFLGFPFILGAIIILTTIEDRSILLIALVLASFAWPTWTRLMRASVVQVNHSDYVNAARTLGSPHLWIVFRHIVPNSITPLVVYAALGVGGFIAAESALTYLGVGLEYPAISWGLQLASAETRFSVAPHLLLFPGAALSITVISFVVIGDLLRDAFDPRAR
ncbi:ABC transporter permease [Phytohabitans kaempferiae]|uniref:ABC transporter permease n=1 Tax=Phytohabitans kaempferiae TaxID=1620943 RepID=A0ABV6MHQ4_9ACTN